MSARDAIGICNRLCNSAAVLVFLSLEEDDPPFLGRSQSGRSCRLIQGDARHVGMQVRNRDGTPPPLRSHKHMFGSRYDRNC